jgi:hypothetical protein
VVSGDSIPCLRARLEFETVVGGEKKKRKRRRFTVKGRIRRSRRGSQAVRKLSALSNREIRQNRHPGQAQEAMRLPQLRFQGKMPAKRYKKLCYDDFDLISSSSCSWIRGSVGVGLKKKVAVPGEADQMLGPHLHEAGCGQLRGNAVRARRRRGPFLACSDGVQIRDRRRWLEPVEASRRRD